MFLLFIRSQIPYKYVILYKHNCIKCIKNTQYIGLNQENGFIIKPLKIWKN